MLNINHTICPECSIGCGLNIISKDGFIVGINPFKNHEINEGKNCKNCTDYINRISAIEEKSFNYEDKLQDVKDKINKYDNNKITIITSGNTDNNDLSSLIMYCKDKGFDLVSYEYEFTKTNAEYLASYDDVEESDYIITVGDIFRKNSLIGRRIIHAMKNDAKTLNIYTQTNLTGFNSDTFEEIESYDQISQIINNTDLTDNTVIIINEIDSKENYESLVKLVEEKNLKILPLLKHPNSYSTLDKTNTLSKQELKDKISQSELIILVNENPTDYLDDDLLNDKDVISFTQDFINIGLTIPLKPWCQKDFSATNSMGLTQQYPDAIEDEENTLKTLTEVLSLI